MRQKEEINPQQLLRLPKVLELLQISKTKFYLGIQQGDYPKQIKLGKTSVWKAREILAFIDNLTS